MSSPISSVDPTTMDTEVSVRVAKLAQNQQKAEGEAAVKLIDSAPPAPTPDGKGAVLNRYA